MDEICGELSAENILSFLRRETSFLSEDILIILGPTASGKTKLAVTIAEAIDAEIISVDSRQVYRAMDIGTGKDLNEYRDIPYHLIDILDPGDKYNVHRFLEDFECAYNLIKSRGKRVIACGGTGFYLQALLENRPYTAVPVDLSFRSDLENLSKEELLELLNKEELPADFKVDYSSSKRMIRGLEVLDWVKNNPNKKIVPKPIYSASVIGLNPDVALRRKRITLRLMSRLEQGLIEEVRDLLDRGLGFEDLEYYGLEYKYAAYYLQGKLTYAAFVTKLETEIHRYAKRQMTYFRKMERDGISIHWV